MVVGELKRTTETSRSEGSDLYLMVGHSMEWARDRKRRV